MKKRIVLALVLGAVLSLALGSSAAFAHKNVETPGTCQNLPGKPFGSPSKVEVV